jgi:hypothetical protein
MTSSSTTRIGWNTCNIFNRFYTLCDNTSYMKIWKKYSFSMDIVQYLGYIVDEHGMHVDLAKIHIICDWPAPTTLTKLQIFLGLGNFYCRFLLGFSHIAWAPSQITRGGGKKNFMWGMPQNLVFNDLKQFLCSTLVLSLSNLQHPFKIKADVLDYAMGVVITQHRYLVAYHSETLLDSICKYPTYEKEIYSILQYCR